MQRLPRDLVSIVSVASGVPNPILAIRKIQCRDLVSGTVVQRVRPMVYRKYHERDLHNTGFNAKFS